MTHGAAYGDVRMWLRVEGLALFAAALAWFASLDRSWLTFVLLFLIPDVSMAGYAIGARAGAIAYNIAHALVLPLALVLAGGLWYPACLPLAAIWLAHIGLDRAIGFGLKHHTAFGDTHLGRIGSR